VISAALAYYEHAGTSEILNDIAAQLSVRHTLIVEECSSFVVVVLYTEMDKAEDLRNPNTHFKVY
jgi:hypothetical protein